MRRRFAALRRSDGTLDAPVHKATVKAQSGAEILEAVRRIQVGMSGSDASPIYLTDPNGDLIWSLRRGGV